MIAAPATNLPRRGDEPGASESVRPRTHAWLLGRFGGLVYAMAIVSVALATLAVSSLWGGSRTSSSWGAGGTRHLMLLALVAAITVLTSLMYYLWRQLAAHAHAATAARNALAESEEKFRVVTENAHAAFGIVRGQRFIYANPYFAELTGYSIQELLSLEFPRLVHPSFQPMMIDLAARRQRGEPVPSHYEFLMVAKNGQTRWIDFSPARIDFDGGPAIIGTGFDVTERKRVEEALSQKAREAEVARRQLDRAREIAESASAAKDRFLAVLSHELRTPLTPVLATLCMLQDHSQLDSRTRRDLEVIRRNVELEAQLIDDMLDVTRIARGKVELDRRPIQLCTILRHAVEVCRPDLDARRLHFDLELGPAAPYLVEADAARLQQVFWNLLKNAIKFTPDEGRVGIRCRREDGQWVVVDVSDTGQGIEPDALERIFSAFEQAGRSTTRQFGGLGLGLTISRAMIQMHGGRIEAHSEGPGKGATFTVRLPLLRSAVGQPQPDQPSRQLAAAGGRGPERRLHILLVEDHGDTARIMKRLLTADGHQVRTAGDVASALRAAASEQFDLLISDLGLPDGSGLELMQQLRRRGLTMPGIALSGYGRDDDIRHSLDAGFSTHLTKPVDFHRLQEVAGRLVH